MTDFTRQARYRVEGMDCGSCATKIATAVRGLPGVKDVAVSVTTETLAVTHDGTSDLTALQRTVTDLGYGVLPLPAKASRPNAPVRPEREPAGAAPGATTPAPHAERPVEKAWWQGRKAQLTIASGIALIIAYGFGKLVPSVAAYAFVAAMLVGLVPIARRAFAAARTGTPFSIETLMTIAAVGAVFIDAAEEAAAVVFLFLVGELLEGIAAGRARASIQALTALVPKSALLEDDGRVREVPAEGLAVGVTILVRPGDRIAADGEILSGESPIDEASVTGESMPVRKGVGAQVFAGTVNGDAALRVRVTAAAADNTIARVVRLVEEAQDRKAPTERFIDHFARYYTPAVVVVAALVAILPPLLLGGAWSDWVYKGLAVLLIGCPCALVISTPAAIAASLSAGARRGLLLKGGVVLENLGTITAVAFDKTGTLTEGKPRVTDIVAFDRLEADVLRIAAALEVGSSHPLASAILSRAEADRIAIAPAANAKASGGKGVSGRVDGKDVFLGSPRAVAALVALSQEQSARVASLHDAGKTVSVLVVDGRIAGVIAMRDEPRADAQAGLEALAAAGIKTIMLTGDNARTAAAIGKQLCMEVRADLLPEDKLRCIAELKAGGFKVAKVGDGINDAPALAAADVGIAMGGGTDVALETADAAILHGRVGDVARMIELSNRTMRNIRQNITIALGLKAVFLATTVLGITGLWPAILADTGATVLVTANALRLLKSRRETA